VVHVSAEGSGVWRRLELDEESAAAFAAREAESEAGTCGEDGGTSGDAASAGAPASPPIVDSLTPVPVGCLDDQELVSSMTVAAVVVSAALVLGAIVTA